MTGADVIDAYRDAGLKIAVAESCTGGLVAAELTDPAGASDVFVAGFVTYSNAAKIDMLGVARRTLDNLGAVSEQVAREMAEGALARSGADVAVSITGIAGPGASEAKPEGRVCFALASNRTPDAQAMTMEFGARGRANVRAASKDHALRMLADALSHKA